MVREFGKGWDGSLAFRVTCGRHFGLLCVIGVQWHIGSRTPYRTVPGAGSV